MSFPFNSLDSSASTLPSNKDSILIAESRYMLGSTTATESLDSSPVPAGDSSGISIYPAPDPFIPGPNGLIQRRRLNDVVCDRWCGTLDLRVMEASVYEKRFLTTKKDTLTVVRHPTHKKAVMFCNAGFCIGYMTMDLAAILAPYIDEGTVRMTAVAIGGHGPWRDRVQVEVFSRFNHSPDRLELKMAGIEFMEIESSSESGDGISEEE